MANRQAGVSIAEILVVIAIIGISVGITAIALSPIEAPLQSGAALVEGFTRQARLSAMASTSAYRVIPINAHLLGAQTAPSCLASTWTTVTGMNVEMPEKVTINPTNWAVCFSSRGISNGNVTITLEHPQAGSIGIEVLLGGTTRVHR